MRTFVCRKYMKNYLFAALIAVTVLSTGSPYFAVAKGGSSSTPDPVTVTTAPSIYSIYTKTADVSGATLNLSGAATIGNFGGREDEQFVKFVWGDGQTEVVKAMTLPSYYKSSKFISLTKWTKSHVYANPGSYNVTVKIYRGNSKGAELYPLQSSTFTLTTESSKFVCLDSVDNDKDGKTDLLDSDCVPFYEAETTLALCSDAIDNDNDGTTDLYDADCSAFVPTENDEISCSNGVDDDLDGTTDLHDTDCVSFVPPENDELSCLDGVDNDLDGFTDLFDPECVSFIPGEDDEFSCSDGVDNDLDGTVDRFDASCAVLTPGICGNSTIEWNESCDDGNSVGGDSCSASCRIEALMFSCTGTVSYPICRLVTFEN
jgi:cysteine-rich repeat protein